MNKVIVPQMYSLASNRLPIMLDNNVIPLGAVAGQIIANIYNIPSGLLPVVRPSSLFSIAGDETLGYKLVINNPVLALFPLTLTLSAGNQFSRYPVFSGSSPDQPTITYRRLLQSGDFRIINTGEYRRI